MRHERLSERAGVFVGDVALTDDNEYCGERASKRVRGQIPACDTFVRKTLICGTPKSFTALLRYVADPVFSSLTDAAAAPIPSGSRAPF